MVYMDVKKKYSISNEVVSRKIEDNIIIVPLQSGVGDLDSEMYSLNHTASAVWERLDGKTSIDTIIIELSQHFDASYNEIKTDVIILVREFMSKGFLKEA